MSPLILLHPSAVSRVLWDVPSAKTSASALPPKLQLPALPPLTLAKYFGHSAVSLAPHSNVEGIFGGVSSHLLQNGAFSFPYGHRAADGRGKEMIARGLLRLGWSQLTQEDEELTSLWALPLLVPFLEQMFHGTGQWKADWSLEFGIFFLPKNHSDTHTELTPYERHLLSFLNSRAPVHKDPKVPLAAEKLNLSCESL